MELLRLITAGSVDDGKSTLIGRLLYDSRSLLQDQVQSLETISRKRGLSYIDFSLITDGLKDELEQGITIDVAYRYFTTGNRKYIIGDTPGHVQYTRNFVTAASNANLAIILIDARKGVTEQTKRHSLISSLMGVKHLVFCINKMDLAGYDEQVFSKIKDDIEEFSSKLEVYDIRYIPMSALYGENIVDRSENMTWYTGWTLLETLENLHISSDRNLIDGRLPVQMVIRTNTAENPDYRGFAGQIASGVFRIGDEVTILPEGINSTITRINTLKGFREQAQSPMSVTVCLNDDIDASRGSIIVKKNNQPQMSKNIDLMICWFSERPLQKQKRLIVRTVNHEIKAIVNDILYGMNIGDFSRNENSQLIINDIGRIRLTLSAPLIFDNYRKNRHMGSVILIDEQTNDTIGAGLLID